MSNLPASEDQQRPQSSYDLHLHSHWSYDATAPVEVYLAAAQRQGMRCIAITDHHGMDAFDDIAACERKYPGVRVLRGAEISVLTSAGATDLVCYGFGGGDAAALEQLRVIYHEYQWAASEAIRRGVRRLGFDYSEADHLRLLRSYRTQRMIDVAGPVMLSGGVRRRFFIERGWARDEADYASLMAEATKECPFYPPAGEIVPLIHAAGAKIALAHPPKYVNGADPERMDALRAECDLDGIECAHSLVPKELTPVYRAYCVEHGLFSTAGSDCHSEDHIAAKLGRHGGDEAWLDELLERME